MRCEHGPTASSRPTGVTSITYICSRRKPVSAKWYGLQARTKASMEALVSVNRRNVSRATSGNIGQHRRGVRHRPGRGRRASPTHGPTARCTRSCHALRIMGSHLKRIGVYDISSITRVSNDAHRVQILSTRDVQARTTRFQCAHRVADSDEYLARQSSNARGLGHHQK